MNKFFRINFVYKKVNFCFRYFSTSSNDGPWSIELEKSAWKNKHIKEKHSNKKNQFYPGSKQKPGKPAGNNSKEKYFDKNNSIEKYFDKKGTKNNFEGEKKNRRNDGGGTHIGDEKIRRYKRPPGYRRGGYYEFVEKPKRLPPIRRPASKPVKAVVQQKDQVSGEDSQQDRKMLLYSKDITKFLLLKN